MDYIEKTLGIKVVYHKTEPVDFPNYITARYRLQMVTMDGKDVLFLYPKTELEQIGFLKKHIERIQRCKQCPVVLILEEVTFHQKESLIRGKISFVVKGKQIYLPFMAVYLQERCSAEKQSREGILPSAQVLFLHYIYKGSKELSASQAARDLNFTPTSISRASRQLEEMGLLKIEKSGVNKFLYSEDAPRTLFENAGNRLVSPVKRTVYIPKEFAETELMKSGYSALSEYSMLNSPSVWCYAAGSISKWNTVLTHSLHDSNTQAAVELWRYDPKKLSDGKSVDVLSLALVLRNDADERIEEAVEEMLEKLWRQIDGYRN